MIRYTRDELETYSQDALINLVLLLQSEINDTKQIEAMKRENRPFCMDEIDLAIMNGEQQ